MGTKMPAILSGHVYIPAASAIGVSTSNTSMSAATDIVATLCEIPKTGNITGIKFGLATVTTGCTVIGTIETVTASIPTGTLYHANATGTVVVANTDDNTTKTITYTSFAATRGDLVALKLAVSSGTPSAMSIRTSATTVLGGFPCQYQNIATVNAWSTSVSDILITYDDGDVVPISTLPKANNTSLNVSSSTSPDEVGVKFVMPFSASSDGWCFRTASSAGAQPIDIVLYDSADGVVATHSFSGAGIAGTGINSNIQGYWSSDVNLLKGRTYRLVIKPTTTTSWTTMLSLSSNIPAFGAVGSTSAQYTSRTNAGAWTDSSTGIVSIHLRLNKIYQPGGSYF